MTSPTLSTISKTELTRQLQSDGLWLRVAPFVFQIRSPIPVVADGLHTLYGDYELASPDEFADFHITVAYGPLHKKSVCVFQVDGVEPFTPLAAGEGFAFLEWGLNWCVTTHLHTWLTIHSAVLERHGRALILPAPPGSGKSTLCASLLLHGWRLLSDEMTLLDPDTGLVTPFPRPVSLKNQSIDIIRKRDKSVVIGPIAFDTMKGNVAHMRAPTDSLKRASEKALPAWVIFPQYVADAPASLTPRGKATSFMQLAENSFNQSAQGRRGFEALTRLIDQCDCYDFSYGRLDEAMAIFADLPLPT